MNQIPHAQPGTVCPLHRKDVSKVCHTCPWWTRIVGKHPQSEEMLDSWQCAIAWLPMLLVENSQQQRQTGAAVESFRNGMIQGVVETITQGFEGARRRAAIGGPDADRSRN
jgi:hypothetical protein